MGELALRDLQRETGGLPVALDESLSQGRFGLSEVATLPGVVAVVLKPSLLGYDKSIQLMGAARKRGHTAVISSMFNGDVALSHETILAAALGGGTQHGLGTYRYFAQGDGGSTFADSTVIDDTRGSISPLACEALLQRTADQARAHWRWRRR